MTTIKPALIADDDQPPPGHPAQAVVEGSAVDADGNQCPTYTDLLVTAPDTTDTVTVPTAIDTCQLEVHRVTAVAPQSTERA